MRIGNSKRSVWSAPGWFDWPGEKQNGRAHGMEMARQKDYV
jgi:hypothetical protein